MGKFTLYILVTILVVSCHRNEKFGESDLSYMPYKGNEKLVFFSTTGDSSVMQLTGSKTMLLKNGKNENRSNQIQIVITHGGAENRFCEQNEDAPPACNFVVLAKNRDGLYLQVLFNGKFRDVFETNITANNTYQSDTMIDGKRYSDLVAFNKHFDDNLSKNFGVAQIFWSKSKGLIGYITNAKEGYFLK